jgi:hypothetical protein
MKLSVCAVIAQRGGLLLIAGDTDDPFGIASPHGKDLLDPLQHDLLKFKPCLRRVARHGFVAALKLFMVQALGELNTRSALIVNYCPIESMQDPLGDSNLAST